MAIDLGTVQLGLVEYVDAVFITEEHLYVIIMENVNYTEYDKV